MGRTGFQIRSRRGNEADGSAFSRVRLLTSAATRILEFRNRFSRDRAANCCFDEMKSIPQASRTMRVISVLLVSIAALITARAQTNYSPMVNFSAVTNSGSIVRSLSLPDCIQLALRNNLDLQIDRYNPT